MPPWASSECADLAVGAAVLLGAGSTSMRSGVIAAALKDDEGADARAGLMDGRQLLAEPGRAGDEHAAVGRRDPFDLLAELIDGRGRTSIS